MKNIIIVLLLLISANALCQQETEEPSETKDSAIFYPSLMQMELKCNDKTVTRKINIEEEDVITILLKNVFKTRAKEYYLKQVDIKDLSSAIKFGKTDVISVLKNEMLTQDVSTIIDTSKIDVTFTIANLEPGKSYKYLVMFNDEIEDQFYVIVDEIIHFEINIGPLFSGMPNPDFVESSVTKDNTGNTDTIMIQDNGTKSKINFALGGVFHPWGYNPRAKISWRNIFIYLGIPFNEKLGENFLLGLGFGYRGISLIGGAHIGTIKRLADGYNLNTRYPKADFDLEKIKVNDIQIRLFAGIALDLDIVGKLFTGLKK
jgi:hypothetical protein